MKPEKMIAEHRRRHNVMAGHYWMELANEMAAEIKRLRAALKPLAQWADHPMAKPTLEDCNRARAAWRGAPAPSGGEEK
jgi:hypothetical protein